LDGGCGSGGGEGGGGSETATYNKTMRFKRRENNNEKNFKSEPVETKNK
tara:strand:+ start:198 stop:344 length:147 start_codon:yes stop_codon:yes gene_type:complete